MNPSGSPEQNHDNHFNAFLSQAKDLASLVPSRLGEHERLRLQLCEAESTKGGHYVGANSRVLVPYDHNPREGVDLIHQATRRIQGYLRGNSVPCDVICEGLYFRPTTKHFLFIASLENPEGKEGEVILPYQRVMTNGLEVECFQNGALLQVTLKPYKNADKVVFEAMEYPELDYYNTLVDLVEERSSDVAEREDSEPWRAVNSVEEFADSLDAVWGANPNKKLTRLKDPASLEEYSITTSLHLSENAFKGCLERAKMGSGIIHEELLRYYSREAYREAIGDELYRTKATPASHFYWIEHNHPERGFCASLNCEEWSQDGAIIGFDITGPLLQSPKQARIRYRSSVGSFAILSQ